MKGNVGNEAVSAAQLLLGAFVAYRADFAQVTRRARSRFERQEWREGQADAAERLALNRAAVDATVVRAREWIRARGVRAPVWPDVKRAFRDLIASRPDCELAETFFNSVTRRVYQITGADPSLEFSASTVPAESGARADPVETQALTFVVNGANGCRSLLADTLRAFEWTPGYAHLEEDVARAATHVEQHLRNVTGEQRLQRAEVLRSVFFRNKGAYLVGRLVLPDRYVPLVLPLVNSDRGITLDAVLLTSDEASVVFGFSRSYFQADIEHPAGVVRFLSSIMPLKRVDELYTSIGFDKHGKTELYRSLMRHLERSDARFAFAEGDEGLVMSVFTLPTFNVVFKIIRDAFGAPKRSTRKDVREKYDFVFVRDRVGRLADAQEFEHLEFPRDCFSPELLDHLLERCASTVAVMGERVLVRHAYTERRVIPLNLFLREAGPSAAREAVLDYGQAIKELAASNIFTGDMLLKNFGVSRHGRVICYDYDELTLLTNCAFRRIPPPADMYDEMSAEPYFYVGEQDVFPEEFEAFLVPPGELRDAFLARHQDLLTVEFWLDAQRRQREGEISDVFPYSEHRRLG